jgi:hypothetical protein
VKSKFRIVEGGKKHSIFQDLEALRIPPDDGEERVQPEEALQPSRERRKFRQLDEAWAERLLGDPYTPPHIRLLIVLLAEADFHGRIKVNDAIAKAAGLSRWQVYRALEHIKRQGYISIERRGRGKAPIVTPLHLKRRRAQR